MNKFSGVCFAVILLSLSMKGSVCADNAGTYVDERRGFSIMLLKGWTKAGEPDGSSDVVFFKKGATNAFNISLNIVVQDISKLPEQTTALFFTKKMLEDLQKVGEISPEGITEEPREIFVNNISGSETMFNAGMLRTGSMMKEFWRDFIIGENIISLRGSYQNDADLQELKTIMGSLKLTDNKGKNN